MTTTVCIQCAMRALVHGDPPPTFAESPEAHAARCHPDPIATAAERRELEAQLAQQLAPRIPASWPCLYCGNKHLNYEGPCVQCGTPYGETQPPPAIPRPASEEL